MPILKLSLTQSDQFQLIETCPANLKHIANPTRSVKLLALKVSGNALLWIDEQDEEMQLIAINNKAENFRHCINPTRKVIETAIRKDGDLVMSIRNASYDLLSLALYSAPWRIEDDDNPSYKDQMIVAKNSPDHIKYIQNPHLDVQILDIYYNCKGSENKKELEPYIRMFQDDMGYSIKWPFYKLELYEYYIHIASILNDFCNIFQELPGSIQILKNPRTEMSLTFGDPDIRLNYL